MKSDMTSSADQTSRLANRILAGEEAPALAPAIQRLYSPRMPHDEILAARLRTLLDGNSAVTEKRMFGGVAFLVNGSMSVGVYKEWLIARLAAESADEALQRPGAKVMDITGRPMKGWLMVAPEGIAEDESLQAWVDESVAFAASLPPK